MPNRKAFWAIQNEIPGCVGGTIPIPTSPSGQRIRSTLLAQADNLPERESAAHQVGARIGKLTILLYNPDNGVTRNFMLHLWMFLLQALTPRRHEVVLIDGNTRPMSDAELGTFAVDERIGLVGIGAMTRMVAKEGPQGAVPQQRQEIVASPGMRTLQSSPERSSDAGHARDLHLFHPGGALPQKLAFPLGDLLDPES